jgi:hypothetical protein
MDGVPRLQRYAQHCGQVARHKNRKTFISSSRSLRASVQNSYLDFFIS